MADAVTIDRAVSQHCAPRFGPDLMVYRGNANDVLLRVGSEIGWYSKFAVGMLVIAVAVIGYAMVAGV